jgi:hypothetical protein
MGLIDLKTDLKNLKYGKDTLGGGYSGQPYIQTPIPEDFNDLGARKDFILRGGANTARDTATDVQRLTKMFFDLKSPNGVLFISKQNVLSQTGVRTQSSGVVNEGTYTPLNTLAQAGVIVSGGHLNKQGDPFLETGAYSNNDVLYGVKVKPSQLIENNRLVRLHQLVTINSSDKLDGFTLNNGNVLSYNGGPNSILGVGKTNIRFASQRTGKQNPLLATGIGSANYSYFTGSRGTGTPVFLSERSDIPSYINNFNGSVLVDTNNTSNNSLLSLSEYRKLSNFTINNALVPSVIPDSQRVLGNGGSFTQKTVNIEDEQVGGLQVNPNKSWITSGLYDLPDFNVNSPQSSSLSKIPTIPPTQKPKQDITNPNGITYRDGSPTSLKYNVSQSKGITNVLGLTQPKFLNPSVYQPSGSGQPLLSPNIEKTGGGALNLNQANRTITYNPSQISGVTSYNTTGKLIDFRQVIRDSITNSDLRTEYTNTGQLAKSLTYSDNNIGVRNQIGNPGAGRKTKKYGSYQDGVIDADGNSTPLDIINASPVGTDPRGVNNLARKKLNDLVTFNICPLNNNNWMTFRAFLGSFSDNYSSTINSQQYVGRGENFYTYGGFSRKISLSWTVAALSKQELIPMYKRLSYLASNTAPIYNDGFMQGPLVKLTVGGYLHEMPGYIESLNFEIGEDSTWEIQIGDKDGSIDRTVSELSHIIKVTSFNFIPIPNYLPQQGAHFIDLWNGEKILWENDSTSIN